VCLNSIACFMHAVNQLDQLGMRLLYTHCTLLASALTIVSSRERTAGCSPALPSVYSHQGTELATAPDVQTDVQPEEDRHSPLSLYRAFLGPSPPFPVLAPLLLGKGI